MKMTWRELTELNISHEFYFTTEDGELWQYHPGLTVKGQAGWTYSGSPSVWGVGSDMEADLPEETVCTIVVLVEREGWD